MKTKIELFTRKDSEYLEIVFHAPTQDMFDRISAALSEIYGIWKLLPSYWSSYKDKTVIHYNGKELLYGSLDFAKNRNSHSTVVIEFPQTPPIKIGEYDVVNEAGGVKVGCTFVSDEQIKSIAKLRKIV